MKFDADSMKLKNNCKNTCVKKTNTLFFVVAGCFEFLFLIREHISPGIQWSIIAYISHLTQVGRFHLSFIKNKWIGRSRQTNGGSTEEAESCARRIERVAEQDREEIWQRRETTGSQLQQHAVSFAKKDKESEFMNEKTNVHFWKCHLPSPWNRLSLWAMTSFRSENLWQITAEIFDFSWRCPN